MGRSIKKGAFVEASLMDKIVKAKACAFCKDGVKAIDCARNYSAAGEQASTVTVP